MTKSEQIQKEIEVVQSEIARFDTSSISIKEWSITTWGALIAYGFQTKSVPIVLASVMTTFLFGFVEYYYRRFQYRFMVRSEDLEKHLKSDLVNYEYKVHETAVTSRGWEEETAEVLTKPQFIIIYGGLVVLGLACGWYVARHP